MTKRLNFKAVQKYLIDDEYVKSEILREYKDEAPLVLERLAKEEKSEPKSSHLCDFLHDLFLNDARLYQRFTARGSYGNYHIDIKGLGGVYFFWAPEFDRTGYFLSIDDAVDAVVENWTDSLTSNSGRSYRLPFINRALQNEIRDAASQKSLADAQAILGTEVSQHDQLWKSLFLGAPIEDVQVCAEVLVSWNDAIDHDPAFGRSLNKLARIALAGGSKVFQRLEDEGKSHIIDKLLKMSAAEVKGAEEVLRHTSGVARMGAGYALQDAKQTALIIHSARATDIK